jgi:ABC-type spermidine/putrescine transport system permease subunit I
MEIAKSHRRPIFDDPRRLGLLLIAPAMLAILSVVLFPMLNSLWLSLQQHDLSRPQEDAFIWFRNYGDLLRDPRYLNSLLATLRFSLVSVLVELVLGVAIAAVLNQNFGDLCGLMISQAMPPLSMQPCEMDLQRGLWCPQRTLIPAPHHRPVSGLAGKSHHRHPAGDPANV